MFNNLRRTTILFGLIVMLGMLLVPPWSAENVRLHGLVSMSSFLRGVTPNDTVRVTVVRQYSPLWSEPKSLRTGSLTDGGHEPWKLDTKLLLLQLGIAALGTGIIAVALSKSQGS